MRTSPISPEIAPQPPASASTQIASPSVPPDRVSVDATRGAQVAIAIARSASAGRWAELADQLGAQVSSGQYQSDAAHLANQILSAAELDARISALFA